MISGGEKIIFVLCIAFVVFAVYTEIDNKNKWYKFKLEHKCTVVEKIKGGTSTGFGIGVNGQSGLVIMDEPDKTSYKCNDGIIYTR